MKLTKSFLFVNGRCDHTGSPYLNKLPNSVYMLLRLEVCCVQEEMVIVQENFKNSLLSFCFLAFRRSTSSKPMQHYFTLSLMLDLGE